MSTQYSSWYIPGEGNQPAGPFTTEQIIESWQAGRLTEKTLCWQEGMAKWLPLAQVEPFAAASRTAAAPPRKGGVFRRLAMRGVILAGVVIAGAVLYIYWQEATAIHKAKSLIDAGDCEEALALLRTFQHETYFYHFSREPEYLLALAATRQYALTADPMDIPVEPLEKPRRQFKNLFSANERWSKRAKSDLADIVSSVPARASDSIARSVTLAKFLEELKVADSKQLAQKLFSKVKEVVRGGHQSISTAFNAVTIQEILGRDSSIVSNILAVVLPDSGKSLPLVRERTAIIQRWAQEQPELAKPLATELVNRADEFARAGKYDLADLLIAMAEQISPNQREQYAGKRVQFLRTRLENGDAAGVVQVLDHFSTDVPALKTEIGGILLQCANELLKPNPQKYRKAMSLLAQTHREVKATDEAMAKYLYGAYLWLYKSKRRALSVLRSLPPDHSLPCLAFVSTPIETGRYPVNREVKNVNGWDRDFTFALNSIEVTSAEEIAVNITVRNPTRGKQTFFVPMTEDEKKRQADELEKSVFYGRHSANKLRSHDNDFYLLDDLGNKSFPKNTGSFFKKWVKKEKFTGYYLADMDPGQEWDERLVFPAVGIGSSSVTFTLATQPGHRPEVKFADIVLRKVRFTKFSPITKGTDNPSGANDPLLVEAPWVRPLSEAPLLPSIPPKSATNGSRPKPPEEAEPSDTPSKPSVTPPPEDNPLSKGPLSGTWQASTGARFRIEDDGKALTIELVFSDTIRVFFGKLTPSDEKTNTKSFTGTLTVVFTVDAPKQYAVRVSATINNDSHLRLRCENWPKFSRRGTYTGRKVFNEILTRADRSSPMLGPGMGGPFGRRPGGMRRYGMGDEGE